MADGWSDEARRRASLARKIKGRLGQAAYEQFKRTGIIPAGLDNEPAKHVAKPLPPPTPEVPSRSVFDSFVIQGDKMEKPTLDALRAIDSVHRYPVYEQRLPIKSSRASDSKNGSYHRVQERKRQVAKQIVINSSASHPQLTILHEIGHFIDHLGIDKEQGEAGIFFSESKHPLAKLVMEPILASPMVERIRTVAGFSAPRTETIGGRDFAVNNDQRYAATMLTPKELFANAYAQYIAYKTQDPKLLSDIAQRAAERYPRHNDPADFEDIAAAFDLLIEELGWSKN